MLKPVETRVLRQIAQSAREALGVATANELMQAANEIDHLRLSMPTTKTAEKLRQDISTILAEAEKHGT